MKLFVTQLALHITYGGTEMDIKVERESGFVKLIVTDGNTTIAMPWAGLTNSFVVEVADMLRAAADELQPDAVPYDDLLFAYNQDSEAD